MMKASSIQKGHDTFFKHAYDPTCKLYICPGQLVSNAGDFVPHFEFPRNDVWIMDQCGGAERYGADRITNGGFDDASGWTFFGTASWTAANGGSVRITGDSTTNNYIRQTGHPATDVDKGYLVEYDIISNTLTGVANTKIYWNRGHQFSGSANFHDDMLTVGHHRVYVIGNGQTEIRIRTLVGCTGGTIQFDNISIREVSSNILRGYNIDAGLMAGANAGQGGHLQFDDVNDRIEIPNSRATDFGWGDATNEFTIIMRYAYNDPLGGTKTAFSFGVDGLANDGDYICFFYTSAGVTDKLYFRTNTGAANRASIVTSPDFRDGNTRFIAFRRKQSGGNEVIEIRYNGVSSGSTHVTRAYGYPTHPFTIGARSDPALFCGFQLFEFGFYNRAFSDAEIDDFKLNSPAARYGY